jgi:hypothetical protein
MVPNTSKPTLEGEAISGVKPMEQIVENRDVKAGTAVMYLEYSLGALSNFGVSQERRS